MVKGLIDCCCYSHLPTNTVVSFLSYPKPESRREMAVNRVGYIADEAKTPGLKGMNKGRDQVCRESMVRGGLLKKESASSIGKSPMHISSVRVPIQLVMVLIVLLHPI